VVKRSAIILMLSVACLWGCNPNEPKPPTAPPQPTAGQHDASSPKPTPQKTMSNDSSLAPARDEVIATVDSRPITMRQLEAPLVEGYGLNVLLNLTQLDLARQEAAKLNITLSAADFEAERDFTLSKMFKDATKEQYPQLLDQFLQQQRVSRPEFELVMQTNAYLRKIAAPQVQKQIGEEQLREAFNSLSGETVQVRHIECNNLQEIAEAKRRLAAGESFDAVARAVSRNARTGPMGGELPPFSMAAAGYPKTFKEASFALKEGEVSDAVAVNSTYHLIKLEKRIPPRAIKYEDVKESVRDEVTERLMQATIATMRQTLAAQTQQKLLILDPVMKKQYDDRRAEAQTALKDRSEISKQLAAERERQNAEFNAATKPTTAPSAAATTTQPAAPAAPAAPTTAPAGAAGKP
jgi:parvulin-like peptidyl-prolyl isomerase